MKEAADLCWKIPMLGFVHSFNISATVAIVLAYLFKAKFLGQTNLTETEQMELLLFYLMREIQHSKEFLERHGIHLPSHFIEFLST
jgi:tRNA C32,U32 (ribose-2'-O)-methylase TrmJ